MRAVMLLALAAAVPPLGPPGTPARAADVASVLETLVRAVANENCEGGVCYVTVDGKAPSRRVVERLARVPRVRPIPATGLPVGERNRVIDLSPVRFASRDRATADASVSDDWSGSGTLVASESCRYHFKRSVDGWELQAMETVCVVM
jgi:hypothetical protein